MMKSSMGDPPGQPGGSRQPGVARSRLPLRRGWTGRRVLSISGDEAVDHGFAKVLDFNCARRGDRRAVNPYLLEHAGRRTTSLLGLVAEGALDMVAVRELVKRCGARQLLWSRNRSS